MQKRGRSLFSKCDCSVFEEWEKVMIEELGPKYGHKMMEWSKPRMIGIKAAEKKTGRTVYYKVNNSAQ